jgi:diamine N-acetyltransferase
MVAPPYQRKGYAKTATHLAIKYTFSTLNLHKLFLIVDIQNHIEIKLFG